MKTTQQQRILNLLKSQRDPSYNGCYKWVGLNEILDLRIGQYNTRIKELRASGHNIENKTEWVAEERHSWFRLNESTRYPYQTKLAGFR